MIEKRKSTHAEMNLRKQRFIAAQDAERRPVPAPVGDSAETPSKAKLKIQQRKQKQAEIDLRKKSFVSARNAEKQYSLNLVRMAKHVAELIKVMSGDTSDMGFLALQNALREYSKVIMPWAKATAGRMLADVSRRDEVFWIKYGRTMGRELRKEIEETEVGHLLQQRLEDQVNLITSLPLKAAAYVHELTLEAITTGVRADELARKIAATGNITINRAKLIARTEISRTSAELTKARAEGVDSPGYIWRTAGDSDVRQSHKNMEGVFVKWSEAPLLSDGTRTHAGCIYNCRCWMEVVLPTD